MIITLVTDQFYPSNHGTSVSAHRLYQGLIDRGHEVRVLTIDDGTHTPYALKERSFGKPIDKVIHSQGMQFAKPDKKIIDKAIEGVDIVHIFMPFKLGKKVIKSCKKKNIPFTAAFHISPENITTTLYLSKIKVINTFIWKYWYYSFYRNVSHIHCPSKMVERQLENHKLKAKKYVISNGYDKVYSMKLEEVPTIFKNKFVIIATGRFSREKRFDLVIKAIKKSRYKNHILLILGGNGPMKKKLIHMARKLPNYPVFLGTYNQHQQISFLNFANLYIHPADIEIEGMSCLEAIACGCLTIVSNSPKSATRQFVSHKNCIFQHGNYKDLANKIDWWIEHPNELKEQREIIVKYARKYTIERSMDSYLKMFESAITEHRRVRL